MSPNPRVLVVDDDPGIRSFCRKTLSEEGWPAAEADSGENALERMAEARFDVVLTDIVMGGMDGPELLRQTRTRFPKATVILMTSHPTLETALEALRDGAADYIMKPFTGEDIIRSVRRCWELRRIDEDLGGEAALRKDLEAAYMELRRLEKIQTDFTGRVSHELKTPVTSITTALDLLASRPLDPESKRLLELLRKGFAKLQATLQDLWTFSELESGRPRSHRRDTDLGSVLKELLKDFQPICEDRRLEVRLDLPAQTVWVWGDPDLLALALKHLVANTVLHNVPGGSIHIALERNRRETVVRFLNTGRPLEPREIPRIFESFYQVGPLLTREVGGLGLGLAIVRRAVTLHGGSITANVLAGNRLAIVLSLPHPQTGD